MILKKSNKKILFDSFVTIEIPRVSESYVHFAAFYVIKCILAQYCRKINIGGKQ